jgi:hypothetical protein
MLQSYCNDCHKQTVTSVGRCALSVGIAIASDALWHCSIKCAAVMRRQTRRMANLQCAWHHLYLSLLVHYGVPILANDESRGAHANV